MILFSISSFAIATQTISQALESPVLREQCVDHTVSGMAHLWDVLHKETKVGCLCVTQLTDVFCKLML